MDIKELLNDAADHVDICAPAGLLPVSQGFANALRAAAEQCGEPVYQYRIKAENRFTSWQECDAEHYEKLKTSTPIQKGWVYEIRTLYLAPQPAQVPDWRHIANEWADTACNAYEELRNVRDGISDPAGCVDNIKKQIGRCRVIAAAPQPEQEPPK